jgi:hypothetical protein
MRLGIRKINLKPLAKNSPDENLRRLQVMLDKCEKEAVAIIAVFKYSRSHA